MREWVFAQRLPLRWTILLLFTFFVLATFMYGSGTASFMYAAF